MGGINLKAKEGFKILVQGTDFELDMVYVRTRFVRSLDGKKLEVQGNVYTSQQKFKTNEQSVATVEIVKIEDSTSTPLPSIGNYGIAEIPVNYDNNDVVLSHEFVISKLSEILEQWHEQDKK